MATATVELKKTEKPLTLKQYVDQFGEKEVAEMVHAQINTIVARREYASSEQAKASAKDRRERMKAELAEFRAFKANKAKKQ